MSDTKQAPEGWASQRDFDQANRDGYVYGTAFIRRNDQGLLERVDPATIEPLATSEVSSEPKSP